MPSARVKAAGAAVGMAGVTEAALRPSAAAAVIEAERSDKLNARSEGTEAEAEARCVRPVRRSDRIGAAEAAGPKGSARSSRPDPTAGSSVSK